MNFGSGVATRRSFHTGEHDRAQPLRRRTPVFWWSARRLNKGRRPVPTKTKRTSGDDNKVVEFPKTAEERRALRKAKQDLTRQRLIAVFVDEAGADQALFRSYDGVAYADLLHGNARVAPIG